MDTRTKGIIATIAAVLLCGCPGLLLCIFGGLTAAGVPVTTEWEGVSNTAPVGHHHGRRPPVRWPDLPGDPDRRRLRHAA